MPKTLKALAKRVRATCKPTDSNPNIDDMPDGYTHWRCVLRYKGRQMTTPFSQGPAICLEPEAEDLLDCLLSDARGIDQPFEDWASDLGLDTDSRKAERCYRVCQKQTDKLKRLLGEDFEAFMDADR